MLPAPVMERARKDWLNWNGQGVSVMEVSHRSRPFMDLAESSERRLRSLMDIPEDYAVLFLHGGASTQFALLPMNYAAPGQTIGFSDSGHWAQKALREARLQRPCEVAETISLDGRQGDGRAVDPDWAYLHRTGNETIDGLAFADDPEPCSVPVFCDLSSCILSRPLDVSRYGLIYAGAQKNIGPAGLTLVIVRKDLLERVPADLPTMLNHRKMAESGSMANTPPTFSWYLADRVFQWLEETGGIEAMARRNAEKSDALYRHIDESGFYRNRVAMSWRSSMNVTFTPLDEALCPRFVEEAEAAGLVGLRGHRAVGGLRASIYNAMPLDGVRALVQFMSEFAERYG
jgi:phosphoserine aminotransferase